MKQGTAYSQGQVIAQLPASARQRLADIELARKRCRAQIDVIHEALEDKTKQMQRLRAQLAQCHPDDREHQRELMDEIESERESASRLDRERDRGAALGRNLDQTLAQVRDVFVPSLAMSDPFAGPLRPIEHHAAAPRSGETLEAAIVRVRTEIGVVRMKIANVHNAPPTAAEAEAAVDRCVAALVAQGRPQVRFGINGKIDIAMPDVVTLGAPASAFSAPSGSASALLAARDAKGIRALIMAELPDTTDGIGTADRTRLLADLDAELLALEYDEENLVLQALAAGLEVHRRHDASGWAVLGLTASALPLVEAAE